MTDPYIPDVTGKTAFEAALAYAKGGAYVVPVPQRSKNPGALLGDRWQGKSVRHAADIAVFWGEQHPRAGVGIHPGRSGLHVIDVDQPDRLDDRVRRAITELRPPFQITRAPAPGLDLEAALDRGDLRGHAIFQTPPGRMLGNSLGALAPGWGEMRGQNGFIVTSPTLHEKPGGEYRWVRTGPIPALPGYVADELPDAEEGGATATDEQVSAFMAVNQASIRGWEKYADAAVAKFRAVVRDGGGHGRHQAACSAAVWIAREAATGIYSASPVMVQLWQAFYEVVAADPGPYATRRTPAGIRREFNSIISWAVGQTLAAEPARLAAVGVKLAARRGQTVTQMRGIAVPTAVRPVADMEAPPEPDWMPGTTPADEGAVELWAGDTDTAGEDGPGVRLLPTLPPEFWAARPYLTHIREFAHGWQVSADVVLYTTLARLSAMLPPTARAHTMMKDPAGASLNLFVAVYDASGAGKSSSASTANSLLMTYAMPGGFVDGVAIGSGQGIPELYMDEVEISEETDPAEGRKRTKKKMIRQQVRHNAYVYVDEGQTLVANMQSTGSVLGTTIRTAWIGGTLGQANATKERFRHVPKASYALGMVVGFQRSTVGPLLADATAGTPQRFCWVAAADPHAPLGAPVAHHELIWDPSSLTDGVSVAATIRQRLRVEDHEKLTGRRAVDPLDSHKNLMMIKFAGLLCILDKRTEIDESDWELAGVMAGVSDAVRAAVSGQLAQEQARQAQQQRDAHVSREMAVVDAQEARADKTAVRTAKLIARYVHAATEPLTASAARRKLDSPLRKGFDEGLEHAVERGWVIEGDDLLTPGPSKPSNEKDR